MRPLFGCALLGFPLSAAAAPELDQFNEVFTGGDSIDEPFAQVFVAGEEGYLTEIEVPLGYYAYEDGAEPGDVTVTVYEAAEQVVRVADGYDYGQVDVRVAPVGDPLATATIPGSEVPSETSAWVSATFEDEPRLHVGQSYAYVLHADNPPDIRTYIDDSLLREVDGYAGGSVFFAWDLDTDWTDYGYQPSIDGSGDIYYIDHNFRTYVEVCEVYLPLSPLYALLRLRLELLGLTVCVP